MKKFFLIALVLALFAGCSQTTTETNPGNIPETVNPDPEMPYYIKNSAWETVDIMKITASRAAAPSLDQALEIVAEYNAANDDDQLFLNTEDIPIEESPLVNIYIVNEGDYAPLAEYIGLDRTDFVARRADFDLDARVYGGILFVDKVPPPPVIIPDTRDPYEKFAIYVVITETGKIYHEEHCQEAWDEVYSKEEHCGYANVEEYFRYRVAAWKQEAEWYGWTVYSSMIYTEPTDPPVE